MAKGNSNVTSKKSRASKPYDVSNSFVRSVTSRVSNFLPRFAGWLTPHPTTEDASSSDDEDAVEETLPPPTKRLRSDLNEPLSADTGELPVVRITSALENHQDRRPPLEFIDGRIAGPSGISRRPELVSSTPAVRVPTVVPNSSQPVDQFINGDDHSQQSDSSVSTSGCSSLVPQGKSQPERKRFLSANSRSAQRTSVADRDTSSLLLSRSMFVDAAYSPSPRPSSAQSKRPSFNSSVFSSPLSPSLGSLSTDRAPPSPFYSGRTQYGGASACRRPRHSLFSTHEVAQTASRSIQIKPVNRTNVADLGSCTARRILDTLDHLTSPVLDAKRIPHASLPALSDNRKRPAPSASPPPRVGGPPTLDLTIPSMPKLMKLQRQAKMQDSTEAAKRVALAMPSKTSLTDTEREYRMRLDSGHSKSTGKMTSRMRELEEEMCEDVNLPNIALPISTLPSFDFVAAKPPPKYVFSKPTALDSAEFLSDRCDSNFTFVSSKMSKSSDGSDSGSYFSSGAHSKVNNTPNFIPYCPSKSDTAFSKPILKEKISYVEVTKNNGQNGIVNFSVGVAGDLKTGSVMDLLGKKDVLSQSTSSSTQPLSFGDMFKPATGSWECSACMERNKSDANACLSCTTPRSTKQIAAAAPVSTTTSTPAIGFGNLYKKPVGSWDCTDCMAPNKSDAVSCACCTKPKPLSKADGKALPTTIGFGNQFKPAVGEWECTSCMLRNKKDALACASCTTLKPGTKPILKADNRANAPLSGFGSQFKPPSDTWECATCMLRTSNDLNVCSVCESKRPGMTNNKDLVEPTVASGFGDMFKKQEGSWDCPSCMLRNLNTGKCVACEELKPGSNATEKLSTIPASTVKFNFDIPPEASSFKFGVDKADVAMKPESTSTPGFVFGTPAPKPNEVTTFMFGMPKNPITTVESKFGDSMNKLSATYTPAPPATTASGMFSFGGTATLKVAVSLAGATAGGISGDRKRKGEDSAEELSVPKVATLNPSKDTPNQLFSATNNTSNATPSFALPTTGVAATVKLNGPFTAVATTTATSSAIPTSSAPSNVFAFGSSKPSTTFGSVSTSMFGAPPAAKAPTPSVADPSKPSPAVFAYGSASTRQTTADGSSSMKPSLGSTVEASKEGGFGALVSSASFSGAASKMTSHSFGDSANKIATPNFNSATTASSFGGFGSSAGTNAMTTSGLPASTPFLFGSSISKPAVTAVGSSKPGSSPFSNASVAPKAANFSFGSQNMTSNSEPPKPSAGVFNFNAGTAAQKTAGPFGFGAGLNSLTNNTAAPTTFGAVASNPSPVFGTPAPLAFGSTPSASVGNSSGFNFGVSSQPNSAVFGFGAVSAGLPAAAPANAGFSFGQTAPPTFNPNVRPTFNFTGGETPNFTAAGTANPLGQRRIIKKAVRRTPR